MAVEAKETTDVMKTNRKELLLFGKCNKEGRTSESSSTS